MGEEVLWQVLKREEKIQKNWKRIRGRKRDKKAEDVETGEEKDHEEEDEWRTWNRVDRTEKKVPRTLSATTIHWTVICRKSKPTHQTWLQTITYYRCLGCHFRATHPFDGDDEDSWSDGSRVDPIAPAILVDPHSDGQHSKHGYTGALGLIKVTQSWDKETHTDVTQGFSNLITRIPKNLEWKSVYGMHRPGHNGWFTW